jgi:hypothetical protein
MSINTPKDPFSARIYHFPGTEKKVLVTEPETPKKPGSREKPDRYIRNVTYIVDEEGEEEVLFEVDPDFWKHTENGQTEDSQCDLFQEDKEEGDSQSAYDNDPDIRIIRRPIPSDFQGDLFNSPEYAEMMQGQILHSILEELNKSKQGRETQFARYLVTINVRLKIDIVDFRNAAKKVFGRKGDRCFIEMAMNEDEIRMENPYFHGMIVNRLTRHFNDNGLFPVAKAKKTDGTERQDPDAPMGDDLTEVDYNERIMVRSEHVELGPISKVVLLREAKEPLPENEDNEKL